MAVDPRRSQIEQDIEDCIALIADLRVSGRKAPDAAAQISALKQQLTNLCTALGRLE